jgi:hypothetical protein
MQRSHRAAAPPPLVMPAIEPGWDDFLAGAAAFTNARAICLPFLPLLAVVCHHRPGRRHGPTPARSRSRARPCRHVALAQTCTPARARPSREGEAGSLALFLVTDLATMLRSCWPRRHGLMVKTCFAHAVAEKGTSSFLVGECTPRHRPSLPHTRVCARLRLPCPSPPFGASPSSAMVFVAPPLYGQLRA